MISTSPFKRKEKKYTDPDEGDFGIGNPFDFGSGFKEIQRMMQEAVEAMRLQIPNHPSANTMYYGYTYTVGPDGKPRLQEFGNFRPNKQGLLQLPQRETFVDTVVDEKSKVVKVIAEMPGVQKEDIEIEANSDSLKIKAERGARKYDTTVPVSVPVESNSAKATYQNGILEVKLKMKDSHKSNSVTVKID